MPTYPNFPSAYQYDLARDGTWVFNSDASGLVSATYSTGEIDSLAAWSSGAKGQPAVDNTNGKICALFPSLRQVSAVQCSLFKSTLSGATPNAQIQYSGNTTNGHDGTWTNIGSSFQFNQLSSQSAATLRSQVNYLSAAGVKAVRVAMNGGAMGYSVLVQSFMIWGTTQPVGLVFWHPSSDIPLLNSDNNLDRGDIYTNQAPVVQQVRVKNTGTQTANNVVVSMDTSTSLTTLDTDTTFSLDGTNFAATQTIASIVAGAISGIIHVKRGTPTDAAGTTRNAAMRAIATTWT